MHILQLVQARSCLHACMQVPKLFGSKHSSISVTRMSQIEPGSANFDAKEACFVNFDTSK
jgi:hypothetical protein